MFHGHSYYLQKPPLGGRPNTKPGDHNALNAHNRWFIWNYHVWGPTWIDMHWNNIWWRARSHMTARYTWGPVTTLHDVGGVLRRRPLDTFFWALTIPHGHGSWARVGSGPKHPIWCTFGPMSLLTSRSLNSSPFPFPFNWVAGESPATGIPQLHPL